MDIMFCDVTWQTGDLYPAGHTDSDILASLMDTDKSKWNTCYAESNKSEFKPAAVLITCKHLLPSSGKSLDLACGRGANALFLAEIGLESYAWDISDVAIGQLSILSKERNTVIHTETRDVVTSPPTQESFDVIVVSRFLDRELIPILKQAVCSKGLIYYQTFIKDKTSDEGPNNPDYRLSENELLDFFQDWIIRYYHEEGSIGDTTKGFRNQAMLVAQKQ